MTPYEFTEINRKYNFQTTFNSKLKDMSKEEFIENEYKKRLKEKEGKEDD